MGMKQKKIVIFSNPPIFHFEKTMKKSEKVNSKGMHVAQSIWLSGCPVEGQFSAI
jgi:hypothetical protein